MRLLLSKLRPKYFLRLLVEMGRHRILNPAPSLKTYEDFIAGFATASAETKQYYWKQIQFAEKERERLRLKEKRRYERTKGSQPTPEVSPPAENA